MNIYTSPTGSPLAPPEWTMAVQFEPAGAIVQIICVISRSGVRVCNLSTTFEGTDLEEGKKQMAEKARAWISDYLTRSQISSNAERAAPTPE